MTNRFRDCVLSLAIICSFHDQVVSTRVMFFLYYGGWGRGGGESVDDKPNGVKRERFCKHPQIGQQELLYDKHLKETIDRSMGIVVLSYLIQYKPRN